MNYKRKIKIKINNFVRKLTLCTCINNVPNVNICRCMRPHIYIHMYVCVCVLETVAMHWVLCASARILNQKLSSAIKIQNMRLFACHKQVYICMRVRVHMYVSNSTRTKSNILSGLQKLYKCQRTQAHMHVPLSPICCQCCCCCCFSIYKYVCCQLQCGCAWKICCDSVCDFHN